MFKFICSFASSCDKCGDEKSGIKSVPKKLSTNASLGLNGDLNNIGTLDLHNLKYKLANKLVSTGVGVVSGLFGTLGLIHMKCLHPVISFACGLAFRSLNNVPYSEKRSEEPNWASVASYSFLANAAFYFVARARENPWNFEKAADIALQVFVPNIILSSIVFGASSLYAKYSLKPSIYDPAIVGGVVGAACISCNRAVIPSGIVSRFYSSDEWEEYAVIGMWNALPILAYFITSACISVFNQENYFFQLEKRLKKAEQEMDTIQMSRMDAEDKLNVSIASERDNGSDGVINGVTAL